MHQASFLTDAAQDIRYGFRLLRQRMGFTLAAILPLALGVGAATAMYSVVDGVMLRPLPFDHPEQLASIWATEDQWRQDPASAIRWDQVVIGKGDYEALSQRAKSFSSVALWSGRGVGMLADANGTFARVSNVRVTSTIFDLLGVRPALGRAFIPGDDVRNGPAIALLSWETWQKSFGGDSGIVGRSVTFEESQVTVVGVMPPGLRLDRANPPPAVWTPALQGRQDDVEQHNRSYRGLARLAPGVTMAQASAEVARILSDVKIAWKGSAGGTSGRATSYQDDQIKAVRPSLLMLAGATALLMLIACVNLAMLMLGEAARRQPEIAARTALGAAPGRLVRQLLTESLVIAGSAATLGMFFGWGLTRILVTMAPAGVPGLTDVRFDVRVFFFTAICAVVAGIASGVLPVIALLKWGRHPVVGAATGLTPRGEIRVQRLLVGVEVALSLMMLVGCSLLGRSLLRLTEVDPGFSADGLVLVELTGPRALWGDSATAVSFEAAAVRELRAIPGVAEVSGSTAGLYNGNFSSSPIRVVGRPETDNLPSVQQRVVLPSYFHTMRVPILTGRDFAEADDPSSTRVAIISDAEARRDFPGQSALGQRVSWQALEWTIIGVAADVHYTGLDKEYQPTIYVSSLQYAGDWLSYLVRATGTADGTILTRAIRERLTSVNPSITFTGINTVPTLVQRSYAEERYRTLLGSLFGVIGTVLAACGMFGVISRTVARRMREAGIRSALGAPSGSLTTLMLRETAIGAMLGVAVGIPAAVWLARSLTPYLYGVTGSDPVAYLAALLLFTAAAVIATVPPARRAARVDPARVLRSD